MSMLEEHHDWSLVEQVRQGNDLAFNTLMERYKRPILNFIYRMITDATEAEDVAQDVFARTYQAIRAKRVQATAGMFSTWLFQVARNASLDCLRHRKRHPAESLSAIEDHGASAAGTGPAAHEEAAVRETGRRIAAAIALLPEDPRTAIVLSEYENLSHADIAAIMKCSPKSVEARLYRARLTLREQLRDLLA
jgi:RNA polymerase sigma-70 factor (ECF subfamily)